MNKGSIITAFLSGLIIVTVFFVIAMVIYSAKMRTDTFYTTSLILSKHYVFNKVITSKNCLSTGEAGVLDRDLIERANADGGELECALLPDVSHYIKVDDLTNGLGWDWKFGYKGYTKWEDSIVSYVTIKDGDSYKPGLISVATMVAIPSDKLPPGKDTNGLLCLTGAAERAWSEGEYKAKCFVSLISKSPLTIHFEGDKICLEGPDKKVCKTTKNANIENYEDSFEMKYFSLFCEVEFKKVEEPSPVLKVKKLECESEFYE